VTAPAIAPVIALDVTPLIGVRTGIGNAVASTLGSLRSRGDVGVLPYALSFRARGRRRELPAGTVIPPFPARVARFAWAHGDRPRIDRWIAGAEILHATNYLTPPSLLPTVVTLNDCAFVRYPELATPELRALEPIVRRAIDRGAVVHTPSRFVAEEVDEIFGPGLLRAGRIHAIPYGVPPIVHGATLSAAIAARVGSGPFVLSLGMLEPRKNLPHLVAAFGGLALRRGDLRLVLAGPDGPGAPAVADAIGRLDPSVATRVIVAGAVDDNDRSALLERAAVLAYPSISEGFGFPVLEAMVASTPVVAGRAGSIPEIAADAALLVEPTDEEALAAAIENALDPSIAAELVALGHVRAARYDWNTTAARLVELYRSMSGSAR